MTSNTRDIPHLGVVIAACTAAVAGYVTASIYAIYYLKDPAMTGDIIGTWKSFAVLAFGFWLGSSSGGKARVENQDVTVTNGPKDPVPTVEEGEL